MIRIGVTCDYETYTDRRGAPAARFLCPAEYVETLRGLGALPVLLPFVDQAEAPAVLDGVDGVVISGGDFDVPPAYYGAEPHPKLGRVVPERSDFERALILGARERGMPQLGVCAGMQLQNVVFGGTLHQDLSLRPNTEVHEQPNDRRQPSHGIKIDPGTLLERAIGGTTAEVNSTHHQIIDSPGEGVFVSATAPDGVIEAIEVPGEPYIVGVQWHPEALGTAEQVQIYAQFVEAARRFAHRR